MRLHRRWVICCSCRAIVVAPPILPDTQNKDSRHISDPTEGQLAGGPRCTEGQLVGGPRCTEGQLAGGPRCTEGWTQPKGRLKKEHATTKKYKRCIEMYASAGHPCRRPEGCHGRIREFKVRTGAYDSPTEAYDSKLKTRK
ncbi:hypothetical protein Tco_1237690 [Tanacetum coccineum]